MKILHGILATGLCIMASCNLPTAPANNSSGSGPLIKATIDDGTGSLSVNGTTSVTALTAGQVQADVAGIEVNAPGRQIHIQIWCNATDVGVALPVNLNNATNTGTATYTKTATAMTPFAAGAGTSGTVTFDNLTLGNDKLTGSFSFTAINRLNATVSVTSGTFGK